MTVKLQRVRSLKVARKMAFGLVVFIRHLQIEPATASYTFTTLQPVLEEALVSQDGVSVKICNQVSKLVLPSENHRFCMAQSMYRQKF